MTYDIKKAVNVAPVLNRRCGKALLEVLRVYFDESEQLPLPSEEAEDIVKSFMKNLQNNVDYWNKRRPYKPKQ
jgi:hypothetical protein